MSITVKELSEKSDDELLKSIEGARSDSPLAIAVDGEFRRRALLAQKESAESAAKATEAARETAKWTKYSAIAIAVSVIAPVLVNIIPSRTPKAIDLQQAAFEKKFQAEAVVVKTCQADPRYATGPNAAATRVYRFENALWYADVSAPVKIEGSVEDVCKILAPEPRS